jgi:DNA-binding response OmpR family regulator
MSMTAVKHSAKILIADDSRLQRSLLTAFLEEAGFTVVCAHDGAEAIELFSSEHPDLVILDIIMPNKDGIEVTQWIRATTQDNYIPIVFFSSLGREEHFSRCIEAGADGFITKPFNAEMLLAKIHSLLRVKALYQEQRRQKRELLKYQEIFEQEQLVAANLYKNILQADFVETSILRYLLSPMALFNGDILLTAKAPGNQFYVLLGDFTGHGLSASVGAGPTADIFYSMARKGFAANAIIKEINRKLYKLLPVNMFLGATLIALKLDFSFLEVIACGLPEHYLVNQQTHKIRSIASKNIPLGIVDSFEPEIQYLKVNEHDYLYLFTDGVIEAENAAGQQFGTEGIIDCLKGDAVSYFDSILARLQQHNAGLKQQDDVTLVECQCDLSKMAWVKVEPVLQKYREPLAWSSKMTFSVQTINNAHPVPIMINFLMDIQGLQRCQDAVFCILNELFTNALEYGLLALDPALKKTNQGLIEFYQLKDERLKRAETGEIRVSFAHKAIANGGCLTIRVQDSGTGFNVAEALAEQADKPKGIGRAKALCRSLDYSNAGTCANASFEWFL